MNNLCIYDDYWTNRCAFRRHIQCNETLNRCIEPTQEYGTNLPTPYTVIDEDDNNDGDVEENDNNNSSHRNSRVGGGGGGAATITSTNNNKNNPNSPTIRSFTDDASDIIGRFFFGMPSSSGANNSTTSNVVGTSSINKDAGKGGSRSNASAVGGGAGGGKDFQRTSSFGSTSTLSTMTASASTRRARAPDMKQRDGDDIHSMAADEEIKDEANKNVLVNSMADARLSICWDKDEIDLWSNKSAPHKLLSNTRRLPAVISSNPSAVPQRESTKHEGMAAEDNWVGRRRLYRERHRKCHDWNSLKTSHSGPSPSNAVEPLALAVVRDTLLVPTMDSSFHPQQRLPRNSPLPQTKNDKDPRGSSQPYDRAKKGRGGAIFVDNEKQHWMPDNICKQCYSCEAPFTLIRRKHHCRLCGMIFCSVCSAYFVRIENDSVGGINENVSNGQSSSTNRYGGNGAQGTIRTCKLCYDHLSERGLGVVLRDNSSLQRKSSSEFSTRVVDASNLTRTPASPPIIHNDSKVSIREPSDANPEILSLTEIIPSELSDQFADFQGAEGVSLSGDFHALSITKHRLEEERRKRDERERAEIAEAARLAAAEEEARETELGSVGGGSSFRIKSQLGSVRQLLKSSLVNNVSNNVEDGGNSKTGVDVTTVDNDSAKAIANAAVTGSGEVQIPPLHQDVFEDIAAATPRLESSSGIEEAILFEPGQSNDSKTSAKIHLGTIAADYLEKITRELLISDAPLLLEEIKTSCAGSSSPVVEQKAIDLWVNTIMTLATRCCSVEPDVKKGDFLDIRPYCKVKTITGGSVEDSAYLSGVLFHKNVSHKKMARVIMDAKIIMLSGGIEYTRTENRIASLDTLLEQEERYMEILVSKIFKVAPNILIVGKSVCRKAQELLLRANIVLIQYVKPALMTRIARQTGATVVSSIDHVINSSILGE